MKTNNIIIVDDHQLVCDGIENIIISERLGNVIAKVNNGRELLHKLNSSIPSLIILDINMPELNGIETIKILQEQHSFIKVLIISQLESYATVKQLKELGANGYLPKSFEKQHLVEAIHQVQSGNNYFPTLENKSKTSTSLYNLTKREIQIIQLICEGKRNKEMAIELFLSEFTIETHRKNILKKTNCKTILELNEIRKQVDIQ